MEYTKQMVKMNNPVHDDLAQYLRHRFTTAVLVVELNCSNLIGAQASTRNSGIAQ